MAAVRRMRRSNRIPLNFVSRSLNRRPRIRVQKEVVSVIPSPIIPTSIALSNDSLPANDARACYFG